MTKLTEFEQLLWADGYACTTFKACSANERNDGEIVYVSENETIKLFDVDEIKEALSSKKKFRS